MIHTLGVKYVILTAPSKEKLAALVNDALATGWRTAGGLVIQPMPSAGFGNVLTQNYCQAVERD